MDLPITSERRQKPRTKIRGIHYLQIEPNNGGLLLDISEGGLSFQAAAPVLNVGAVHFSFSSHLKGQIEAEGEVVWKSVNKKVVGLRFTRMTPEAWECVRELLASNLDNKAETEATPSFTGAVNAKPHPRGS